MFKEIDYSHSPEGFIDDEFGFINIQDDDLFRWDLGVLKVYFEQGNKPGMNLALYTLFEIKKGINTYNNVIKYYDSESFYEDIEKYLPQISKAQLEEIKKEFKETMEKLIIFV